MPLRAPTPPTPPTIDKGDLQASNPRIDAHQFFEVPQMPFRRPATEENSEVEHMPQVEENPTTEETPKVEETPKTARQVTTPEDMARDAVANGSGPLTRREITRADNSADTVRNDNANVAPPIINAPANSDSYERGQAVLREFREEDNRLAENPAENPASTSTPPNFQSPTYQEGHGGFFWIATLIFVIAVTFFVAKKFLFRSKPALKKSDLFLNSGDKLKATAEKFSKTSKPAKKSKPVEPAQPIKPVDKPPPVKPARLPKKDDDDKGKHFEIRV